MRTRGSTTKRLLKLIIAIAMISLSVASSVFAANTEFLPTFAVETLTPSSQAAAAWKNTAPNALASYYTYQPLTNADALLAGFPAACGDKNAPAPQALGDTNSTLDCYIITVKKLIQPMSLDFLNLAGISAAAGANLFPGPGLIKADGLTPFVNQSSVANLLATASGMTTAWGYGSGGNNWQPYGLTGPTLARGNAPAAFASTPIGLMTGEGAGVTGIWHFPAPTIKGKGTSDHTLPLVDPPRPVLVLWKNDLPNEKPVGHDPSVDCGEVAEFCYPYNRIVTHVHGAHVGPESDGLAVAWYNKDFKLFGEGKFTGTYANHDGYLYTLGAGSTNLVPAALRGAPLYYYPLTQEAGTIWYHDHAIGTTHLNTDMGMAGFFPLTDSVEIGLQTPTASVPATTPALLPVLPTGNYELGFALQDRHFDVNGQMVFPAAAVYDKNDVNCVFDADNNALPGTCARLHWMKETGNPLLPAGSDPTPAVRLVPFNQTTLNAWKTGTAAQQADYALNFPAGCKVNTGNTFEGVAGVDPVTGARVTFTQCAPFPAQSATLEYFGNIPVVNGVTYATYPVEPTVYRMRLIGGTDSRAWVAQLVKGNPTPSMVDCGGIDPITLVAGAPNGCAVYPATSIIPFFQVGTEQGLLPTMVRRAELDIMGGERIDVLVDFSAAAGQTVTMKNLGDDAPYSGRFDFDNIDVRQPTSVNIPEIMKFVVAKTKTQTSAKTPADGVVLKAAPALGTPTVTRTIALIEITDQYGRTMPTVDARGYVPPGIRTTEVMKQGDVEYWDIVNTTVDAHPMHIHQVPFLPIFRQALALNPDGSPAASGFKAAYNSGLVYDVTEPDKTDAARSKYVFTPSQYLVDPASSPIPVERYDAGWKDTINTPPGYVVRNKIMFDILGDYVWHCHILSHEEHDMMRPFRVTNLAPLTAPTSVVVGAVASGRVSVEVLPAQPAPIQHVVQIRKVGTPFWSTSFASTSLQTVNVDAVDGPGTYEFRAQYVEPAIQNVHVLTAPESAWTYAVNQPVYSGVSITTGPLAAYVIGSGAFNSVQFAATGGVPFAAPAAPYTWTWAAVAPSTLPPGLTFVDGLLAGTPTTAGVYNFNVTACDSPDLVSPIPICDTQAFSLTVQVPAAITFTPANSVLAPFQIGSAPSVTVTITPAGGVGAKTCVASAGNSGVPGVINTLPTGLTLSAGCVLSGLPTVVGNYSFTVTATDTPVAPATASTGFIVYTMAVTNPPARTLAPVNYTLPSYTLGTAYTPVTFTAAGGNGAFTYAVTPALGTGLPTGSILDANTGVLSIPTAAGSYVFEITATDSSVPTAGSVRQLYAMTVNPAAAITITAPVSTTLAISTQGTAITPVTFTAAGGIGALTINGTVSPVGAGLSVTAGVLSGTPTTAGMYTITVTGSDVSGTTAVAKVYSMDVLSAIPVAPATPTVISPLGVGVDSSSLFVFSAVSGATGYQIWHVDSNGVGVASAVLTPTLAGCPTNTGNCSVSLGILANGKHFWQVVAQNVVGNSAWSPSSSFTVSAPVTPTQISPTGAGIVNSAPFVFTSVTGATGYQIWHVDPTSGGVATAVLTPTQAGCPNNTGNCSVSVGTLSSGTHFWQVKAQNAVGSSIWSPSLSFTTP